MAEGWLPQSPSGAAHVQAFHRQFFTDSLGSAGAAMKQLSGGEVREATARFGAATVAVPFAVSPALSCQQEIGRSEVLGRTGVPLSILDRADARRKECHERAGKRSAIVPRQHAEGNAARFSERNEIERDLVRDTEAYLDERARGLTPSLRLSEAWDRFFRYGTSLIRGSMRARGLSGGDRDDCEQEFWTEVVAQLSRSQYDPARAGLGTWLSALARNKSADVIRRRVRRHPLPLDELALTALPGRDDDPASALEHGEEQAFVRRALGALSQVVSDCSYRVLFLREIEELDVSEVAAALGLTPEQVRYRHCRTKLEMRRLVETMAE